MSIFRRTEKEINTDDFKIYNGVPLSKTIDLFRQGKIAKEQALDNAVISFGDTMCDLLHTQEGIRNDVFKYNHDCSKVTAAIDKIIDNPLHENSGLTMMDVDLHKSLRHDIFFYTNYKNTIIILALLAEIGNLIEIMGYSDEQNPFAPISDNCFGIVKEEVFKRLSTPEYIKIMEDNYEYSVGKPVHELLTHNDKFVMSNLTMTWDMAVRGYKYFSQIPEDEWIDALKDYDKYHLFNEHGAMLDEDGERLEADPIMILKDFDYSTYDAIRDDAKRMIDQDYKDKMSKLSRRERKQLEKETAATLNADLGADTIKAMKKLGIKIK